MYLFIFLSVSLSFALSLFFSVPFSLFLVPFLSSETLSPRDGIFQDTDPALSWQPSQLHGTVTLQEGPDIAHSFGSVADRAVQAAMTVKSAAEARLVQWYWLLALMAFVRKLVALVTELTRGAKHATEYRGMHQACTWTALCFVCSCFRLFQQAAPC